MNYYSRHVLRMAILMAVLLVLVSFFKSLGTPINEVYIVHDVKVTSDQLGNSIRHVSRLPYLFQNNTSDLRSYSVEFEFIQKTNVNNSDMLAIFSPQILHGGDFYVNGKLFYQLPSSTTEIRRAWYEPLITTIPTSLLSANQTNSIKIEFKSYQRGFVIPTLMVGSSSVLMTLYKDYKFISTTLSSATNIFCWVVGSFMISLWLLARSSRLFAYAGCATILWATLFTLALTAELPLEDWIIWRFMLYASTGGLVLLMSLFLFEYARTKIPPYLMGMMLFSALGVPCFFLFFDRQIEYFLDIYWTGLIIGLYVIATINLIKTRFREKNWDLLTLILIGHSFVATVFAYHDYGVQAGPLLINYEKLVSIGIPKFLLEPIFLTHFTLPLLLIIVWIVLLQMHIHQMLTIERANQKLEFELVKKEKELTMLHEVQKTIIHENAINSERSRILQDIHDGLGSRLINLLLGLRMSQLGHKTIEIGIQECLEDLRLLVSGQFINEISFTDVLDEFCQRVGRNLRAAGVQMTYRLDQVEIGEIDNQSMLHLLRIVQEMVSNTIKHSNAKNCEIILSREDEGRATLSIKDDGVGFDMNSDQKLVMKRGILGIRRRLMQLNYRSNYVSDARGTALDLEFFLIKL